MAKLELVSLDLFGTLVDIRQNLKPIWRSFFNTNCSQVDIEFYWERANEILRDRIIGVSNPGTNFKSIRQIFEDSFVEIFKEAHLNIDVKLATDMWVEGHKAQNIYPDVKMFLDKVNEKVQVCLTSECDLEMISNINDIYDFDYIFSSQSLQCYKHNPQFWQQLIAHYNFPPNSILHIGDANSDVISPAGLGIKTCWLNRHGRKWNHSVKPNFEVASLIEINEMLNTKIY